MSMTPPIRMVSVPVEPLKVALDQAKRGADKAGCDGWRAQEMCRQIVQLLEPLTAAPVREEGGAEDRFEQYVRAAIDNAPDPLKKLGEFLTTVLDEDHWATAERYLLALATREEAPAFDLIPATVSKADGSNPRKVYVDRVEGRIYEIAPAEAGEDDLAARLRRAETWDLDADKAARDRCGVLMLEAAERLEALRAQPQAREEAQPVAWRYRTAPHRQWHMTQSATDAGYEEADGSEVQPLYTTPPAPEAEKLRVAVEALKPFAEVNTAGWSDESPVDEMDGLTAKHLRRAAKALAALQQEGW